MTDPSIKRQQERERRERLERERLKRERIDRAEELARADRQRTDDMLMTYQKTTYYEKALRLFMLNKFINGD